MDEVEVDVRYEPDHEAVTLDRGRPMLTWGRHPQHGYGWTLSYLEDESETAGIDDHFIPGDLTDVDAAVESARIVASPPSGVERPLMATAERPRSLRPGAPLCCLPTSRPPVSVNRARGDEGGYGTSQPCSSGSASRLGFPQPLPADRWAAVPASLRFLP